MDGMALKGNMGRKFERVKGMQATATINKKSFNAYFKDYPDVLDVEQMSEILNVSTKTGYKLLAENKVQAFKIGRSYRIPKVHLYAYLKIENSIS